MAKGSASKRHKAEARVLGEMRDQLLLQAGNLGIRDDYTQFKMCELEAEAFTKHLSAFYAERSNLKYEMQIFGTNKLDLKIKLERLEVYIKRAEKMRAQRISEIEEMIEDLSPDSDRARKLLEKKKRLLMRVA